MKIKSVRAYEILASGGYPTVECVVVLQDGSMGRASVPYGASAGTHEAIVLQDGDSDRWAGQGMQKAVGHINDLLAPELVGKDALSQRELDTLMLSLDGTENKARLGGNAILAISLAVAKAAAQSQHKPLYRHLIDTFATKVRLDSLPQPMTVVIEGGKHADHTTDFQEFCYTAVKNQSVTENVRMILETYHHLGQVLKKNNLSINVGNEGAYAPSGIPSNEAPFEFMLEAINLAGYQAGTELKISLDPAASEFYRDGKYHLTLDKRILTASELIEYYQSWLKKYPIATIEDMLAEDDWDNWPKLKVIADKYSVPLIGDDLTVTNLKLLNKAIDLDAISGLLVKPNQIGSVTETMDCSLRARDRGLMTVTSHRGGGETNDTSMVDLAVAVGSAYIKVGPTRGERVAKYNRLMEIERQLELNYA